MTKTHVHTTVPYLCCGRKMQQTFARQSTMQRVDTQVEAFAQYVYERKLQHYFSLT